ncbi:hypothetical protein U1Q18_024478, partial [Sarracenia purpurea var. burkii]
NVGREQTKAAAVAKRGGKATAVAISSRAVVTDLQNACIVENSTNGVDTLQEYSIRSRQTPLHVGHPDRRTQPAIPAMVPVAKSTCNLMAMPVGAKDLNSRFRETRRRPTQVLGAEQRKCSRRTEKEKIPAAQANTQEKSSIDRENSRYSAEGLYRLGKSSPPRRSWVHPRRTWRSTRCEDRHPGK